MPVAVQQAAFDPGPNAFAAGLGRRCGGHLSPGWCGTNGGGLLAMEIEHYPGMTAAIEAIVDEATLRAGR
jgi:hypothetical protein